MVRPAIIEQIRRRRAENRPTSIPRIGLVPREPTVPEREYTAAIRGYTDAFARAVINILLPALEPIYEEAMDLVPDPREDAFRSDQWADDLDALLNRTFASFTDDAPSPLALATAAAFLTNDFNERDTDRVTMEALEVEIIQPEPWLEPQIDSFVDQNVTLITNIGEEAMTQVSGIIQRGFANGTSLEMIGEQVTERLGISRRRGARIARDQIATLNGQLNKFRHLQLGITEYIWVTMGDARVRPEHAALNGRRFSYENPPAVGNPSEPIECRCVAQPVFEEIRDAV